MEAEIGAALEPLEGCPLSLPWKLRDLDLAMEAPDLLVNDIRVFLRELR